MPPDAAALEEVLAVHVDIGLLYLAFVESDGEVRASAGASTLGATDLTGTPLLVGGDRVRLVAPLPPGPPPPFARRAPDQVFVPPFEPDARPQLGADRTRRPPHLILEFTPQLSRAVQASAVRNLVVSTIGAVVLMLAAAVFWRLSLRADALTVHAAEQRHLAALGEMSAVLAHEIRNPLASLKGHAQLLEETLREGRSREKAALVVRESQRLETLVNRLLDYVRAGEVDLEPADPVQILRDAAEASGASPVLTMVGAPQRWLVDPPRMGQVLVNLLRNARQATPQGVVEATVTEEGGQLVYTVEDDGPGLPAELGDTLFEPFRTTRTTGVGLGLAVAVRIVHRHGGTLDARDRDRRGARFTVRIPSGEPEPSERSSG